MDYKGNVWIGGNGRAAGSRGSASDEEAPGRGGAAASRLPSDEQPGPSNNFHDNQVLKFTQEGKFLLQIGKPNQSRGSNDPDNLKGPAQIFVDPKTNEAYVSDGYGNHRVVVFDADTGKYKRHWGAYGNKPDDATPAAYKPSDPPAQQFRNPVHCVQIANDGLVYVCDRQNDRIQVFHTDGTFVKEAFVNKDTLGSGSAWELTFSRDPQQKFVYLTDGENDRIHILERDSLKVLTHVRRRRGFGSRVSSMASTVSPPIPRATSTLPRLTAASGFRSSFTKALRLFRAKTSASCGRKSREVKRLSPYR